MHPSQKPSDADCNQSGCVGLGLDLVSKPAVQGGGRLAGRIGRLPLQVLRFAGRLIGQALRAGARVSCDPSEAFRHFAAYIASGAFHAVLIHDVPPVAGGT
jgi:hypothetical protein